MTFRTVEELREYSFGLGRIFPISEVESNGETNIVLRHLLRRFAPPRDVGNPGQMQEQWIY